MGFVNICPKTETEVIIASERLGCHNQTNHTISRDPYMCIPNKEKTSLVEFCYNTLMGIHEKGYCLEANVGMVTEYNCKNFSYGCPDKDFFKDEFYKYPACQDINTKYQCYVMDPSCPRASNYESTINFDAIIYACVIVGCIVVPIIIGAISFVYNERRERKKPPAQEPTKGTDGEAMLGGKKIEDCNSPTPSDQNEAQEPTKGKDGEAMLGGKKIEDCNSPTPSDQNEGCAWSCFRK